MSAASETESATDSSNDYNTPLNPLETARAIIESTGVNLFLTGKAGTGKTTFLRKLAEETCKRHVILAPTGVAAINAGGSTIHSFFQLSFAPYIPGSDSQENNGFRKMSKQKLNLIRTLDLIIIDEISMVRPDLLDAVDDVLRRLRNPLKPFGGVQLLMIGDLRQLAPVMPETEWTLLRNHYASPYFFESHALRQAGFLMVELTKVFRQTDAVFLDILNKIRDNRADSDTLSALNSRADKKLFPENEEGIIRLTSHNYRANAINREHLDAIDSPSYLFEAEVSGNFPESSYPADQTLELKQGAQVMFIKNDASPEHRYYNGLIGHIVRLGNSTVTVKAHTPLGEIIEVSRVSWENLKYTLTPTGEIKEEIDGVFTQIPLRQAWAITIHKSQGLTFDRAIVDAANSFAPGQTYVALSRCRTMNGLYLESPLPPSAIMTDPSVNRFISSQPKMKGDQKELDTFRDSYYRDLVLELFNFHQIELGFDSYFRAAAAALSTQYPIFISDLYNLKDKAQNEIWRVASNFRRYLTNNLPLRVVPEIEEKLNEKMRKASGYYFGLLSEMNRFINRTPLNIDNQLLLKRLTRTADELTSALKLKIAILQDFKFSEFNPQEYLSSKARAILQQEKKHSSKNGSITRLSAKPKKSSLPAEITDPELYKSLVAWRARCAGDSPAYQVLSNKVLIDIANNAPLSVYELKGIKGMGPKKIAQYSKEILEIIQNHFNK